LRGGTSATNTVFFDPEGQSDMDMATAASPNAVHDLGRTASKAVKNIASSKGFAEFRDSAASGIKEISANTEGLKVVTDQAKTVLLRVASVLVASTYLEDSLRMIVSPISMSTYVSRSASLWWPLAAFSLTTLVAAQLSSVLLMVPLDKYPHLARWTQRACVALGINVFAQPVLFNAWSYELFTLSIAQLGALAIFFMEALAVEKPAVARAASVAYVQLSARFALTTDLVLTMGGRFFAETSNFLDQIWNRSKHLEEHQKMIDEVLADHQRELMDNPGVDEHPPDPFEGMEELFQPPSVDFHDIHTAFAAALMLAAGVMIWLGFRTRTCGTIAALGALIDATYRFPFYAGGAKADWNRFHFFQAMTPVGGLALIAAFGPGEISLDEKRKKGM